MSHPMPQAHTALLLLTPLPKSSLWCFFLHLLMTSASLSHLSHPLTTLATFPMGVFRFSLPCSILCTSRLGKSPQAANPSHTLDAICKTQTPSQSFPWLLFPPVFNCSGDEMRKLSLLLSSDELRVFIQPSFIRDANQTLQLHILTQWGGKSLMERKP